MWVMTSWGILMPGLRPSGTVESGDARTIQVRARRKSDLQTLRDRYMPDTLGPIIQIPQTDYEYRAYCTPEAWGDALAAIGRDIDYVKFKETAETRFGDKPLHDLYVRVWGVIFSALSTAEHRESYWHGARPEPGGRGKNTRGNWWDDAVDPGERRSGNRLTASQLRWSTVGLHEDGSDAEIDEVIRGWWQDSAGDPDFEEALEKDGLRVDGNVVRRQDGSIDHSFCEHHANRKARRACRRDNPRSGVLVG